jgi:hypothetical protein
MNAAVDPETGEIDTTGHAATHAERLAEVRTQLEDPRVRQQIRDTAGPSALSDVLYYAQNADNANLPGKTSDKMLNLAEELLFRGQFTKPQPTYATQLPPTTRCSKGRA